MSETRHMISVAEELIAPLREAGIEFELLPHERTMTASSEATALGVGPQTVAKTLVLRDETDRYVRAVLPATRRLDVAKLAGAIDAESVALVDEAELVDAFPEFELGAVPPFGGPAGDRVVVDRALATGVDHVVLEAGVHDMSLRLRTNDLLNLTGAVLADIEQD